MFGAIYCSKPGCICKSDILNSPKLQQEVESIRKHQMRFICIDCLKTDGDSKKAGACRLFHTYLDLYILYADASISLSASRPLTSMRKK